MATQPKPKPKPEPDPEPDPLDDAKEFAHRGHAAQAAVDAIIEQPPAIEQRVAKLEERLTALEERVAAPPVGLGKRP